MTNLALRMDEGIQVLPARPVLKDRAGGKPTQIMPHASGMPRQAAGSTSTSTGSSTEASVLGEGGEEALPHGKARDRSTHRQDRSPGW
jgi:hypothetical protein